jgi:hypoxanthine phosphoribosyltransferase
MPLSPNTLDSEPTVYLIFCGKDTSEADRIDKKLRERGINVLRYDNEPSSSLDTLHQNFLKRAWYVLIIISSYWENISPELTTELDYVSANMKDKERIWVVATYIEELDEAIKDRIKVKFSKVNQNLVIHPNSTSSLNNVIKGFLKKPGGEEKLKFPLMLTHGKSVLEWDEIGRGLEYLTECARNFEPSIIFGINRGGAIIGGMIAKQLEITQLHIIQVNINTKEGVCHIDEYITKDKINPDEKIKILITDDSLTRGQHMFEAQKHLRATYPQSELKSLVMVMFETKATGTTFDCDAAYLTDSGKMYLPWDQIPKAK